MLEYVSPELAWDVVKGLVAGAASLALQAVGPRAFRALKSFRALKRYQARRRAQKAARAFSSESLPRAGRGEDSGSREEGASKQETRAPVPTPSERGPEMHALTCQSTMTS